MKALALSLAAIAVAFSAQSHHPYASDKPMPDATLFAEGVINSAGDEYGPTFSPDGNTLYFAKRTDRRGAESIVVSRFEGGIWTTPEVTEFSGKGSDKEPYLTIDGRRLFFASTRSASDPKDRDFNLYVVEQTASGWSVPLDLGENVNTPEYENYPAVAAMGNLYFGSVRKGGIGKGDLYCSKFVDGKYQKAELLTGEINTLENEADPYIAPDESYIIFSGDIPGNAGQGDLYVSFNQDGKWSKPRSLGPKINTDDYEYTPLVSPDRKYLFFSRGWGDIYQIDLSAIDMKPQQ
jgi:hypothetical protein